ncbi:hypothetical protein Baya_1140 [Bagarius yarrelli]|uniref:Uncharacterized protein n=1 Tax=Bagarius yarrelli TaxID=175774 RepID=A0A556TKA0_BAGYA|nr:hypothetical protein Baya_1140 [Bagarius yarrelli]
MHRDSLSNDSGINSKSPRAASPSLITQCFTLCYRCLSRAIVPSRPTMSAGAAPEAALHVINLLAEHGFYRSEDCQHGRIIHRHGDVKTPINNMAAVNGTGGKSGEELLTGDVVV